MNYNLYKETIKCNFKNCNQEHILYKTLIKNDESSIKLSSGHTWNLLHQSGTHTQWDKIENKMQKSFLIYPKLNPFF